MSFILGMDTGGTYTDAVILASGENKILHKSKALTTKEDLTVGIGNCIDTLEFNQYSEVKLVSLSTTLATNAIVEGGGGRAGLFYFGAEPEEPIPTDLMVRVRGKFDIMGRLQEDLDEREAKEAIEGFRGKVDAVAISGYASVRNPKHEDQLATWVREILDVPTVCAHHLTSVLGYHQRTVTAVLNARLIPIIDQLLKSTEAVLAARNITAPIMVVKGDGTLMTETLARKRPIETILSGPAASVIGGFFLTGNKDALVLDMGGTTTDIVNVEEGMVKIKKEGAKVGGWLTRVQAVAISTFGLGGDSHIYLDEKGRLQIGPHRVIPLCVAGETYPALIRELRSFRRTGEFKSYSQHETDCFQYVSGEVSDLEQGLKNDAISEKSRSRYETIIMKLKEAPHSLTYLADVVGEDPECINLDPLVERGILARISFTPTDVLHVQGRYTRWNSNLSRAGAEILSKRMEVPLHKFLAETESLIVSNLALDILQSIADFEDEGREPPLELKDSQEAMYLLSRILSHGESKLIQLKIAMKKPIVAIGAPAKAWVEKVGSLLGTEIIVPEHAEVANAIGAAVGQLTESVELLVSVDGNKFILNMPWSRTVYATQEEAAFYAIHEGRKYIEHALRDAGCNRWEITEQSEDIKVEITEGEAKEYMGTKYKITGVGSPLLLRNC